MYLCIPNTEQSLDDNFVQETISEAEKHQTTRNDFVCLAWCFPHSIRTLFGQVVIC